MKNAVKLFTYLTLAFMLLYSVSAMASGWVGIVLEVLAFALPVAFGYAASRRLKSEREELRGVAERESTLVTVSGGDAVGVLALTAPVIAIIFLISYLTSLLLGALGLVGSTVEDAPLFEMLVMHALMPAILEEAMFRYLPMKLIAPYSRRWCAVLSAIYFALIHGSLFQLPYALAAGFIFIIIDLAADSVLPSVALHLLNNAVSVLWIKYSSDAGFAAWYVGAMAALALLSLIPVLINRRKYLARLRSALDAGENLTERAAPTVLVVFLLIMTAINLIN